VTTSDHAPPDDEGRVAREMKTVLEAPLPSVAIRHIRHIAALDAPQDAADARVPAARPLPAGAHGVTTRELSSRELAHELELLRLTGLESSTRTLALPGRSLPVTLEMSLDELLPPAQRELLLRGEAPRTHARAVVHTDATPTLIARTSDLFPREGASSARSLPRPASTHRAGLDDAPSTDPQAARYKGPAPSVAPPAAEVANTHERSSVRVPAWLGAALVVGATLLALAPHAPQMAPRLHALRGMLGGGPSRHDATSSRPAAAPARSARPGPAGAARPTEARDARPATREPTFAAALSAHPQHAAELYQAGRYKEALAEYRMLAALHPARPAYAELARDLHRRLVAACVSARPGHLAACHEL
jgi:hypothetical protein